MPCVTGESGSRIPAKMAIIGGDDFQSHWVAFSTASARKGVIADAYEARADDPQSLTGPRLIARLARRRTTK